MYEIRKNVYIINTKTDLLNKNLNKEDLTQNNVIICQNSGNGSCFYKALSQFYTNKEDYQIDKQNYSFIYVDKFTTLSYDGYYNNMILTGTYARQYKLFNSSIEFKCNLIIYRQEYHNVIKPFDMPCFHN